jgi:L-serine deaminase
MSQNDTAVSLYDTAIRHLDDVIKIIEDLPVGGLLLDEHSRTAVRLLRDAYDLWRGLTAARDALTTSG